MKNRTWIYTVILCLTFVAPVFAEDEEVDQESAAGKSMEPPPITLYQVGQLGKYCVSLTKDAGGCISGTDNNGDVVNVMDVLKGGKVVFQNISDAPHDMKISGVNGEDLPPQESQGAAVEKGMLQVDLSKQKITCSFHGDQLGLGYRVPEAQAFANGHNTPLGSTPQFMAADGEAKPIAKTGLADVASFIMNGIFPDQKKKLMQGRPDMVAAYPQIAAELGMKGGKILVGNNGAVAGFLQPNSAAPNAKPGDGKVTVANVSPKAGGSNAGAGGANSAMGLVNTGEGAKLIGFKKTEDNADGGEFNLMPLKQANNADTYIEFTDTFDSSKSHFKLGKDQEEKAMRGLASQPMMGSSGWLGITDSKSLWWMLALLAVGVYVANEYKDKFKTSEMLAFIAKKRKEKSKE